MHEKTLSELRRDLVAAAAMLAVIMLGAALVKCAV
jgi:hypothetical protein